ncbi:GntR family transcriptional regulator [Sphaerochaeta halotolerans]|jgi:DNA-binding GntR family transcriptional regulator|uniref:GntR family transcriptional regulator n=1 Tax=Sphaerochaeta halotolerans TaxID=2293840 RepID=A0A372MG48_9SPIR|nr:GntR family transcriptional regulator [Sphaerochaeta halotolerans]MBG0767232.1 GntR family transcriptional regulator [Spirochaetaceae bacterium]MDK2860780.1 GntR family transcriptional regulator [Sphaerochaeta sp.]MDN5334791.1 GntR family transcriptional regulator [Sphaerochaeta sp.]MXI86421.1 GntR family transcriptional regulator [Sphaerochaeta halotolerans]RFU94767.1 GntR family transcriptional regulator [Sphaerochaeta halotolerans]
MALKFKTVFSQLQMKIIFGEWPEGYRIPTEMELCEQYGVSRVTIRRALDGLVRQGYISRTRGRGSFVLFKRKVVGLGYPQVKIEGKETENDGYYKIILKEKLEVSHADREKMHVSDDPTETELWHFKSLHIVDGKPSVLSDYYVTSRFGQEISLLDDESERSFFDLVSLHIGQKCHFVQGKVAAINPNEEICKQLDIDCNSASLWCRGLCVLDDGTVIGRCTKVFNGLMYEFAVEDRSDVSIGG